ncbi:anti-repressor SinI family protein [Aneurinibacillus sp. REN35]|uniref:anti-repressor SinI family protein n=1 Tax=Aneurinibacillus sp. REN35 TaxID=3237286 RepID=UPI003527F62E
MTAELPLKNLRGAKMVRKQNELDQEWVSLMLIARELGITPEEIRSFLKSESNAIHQVVLESKEMTYHSYRIR